MPRFDWSIAHVSLGTSRRVFAQMGTFSPPQRYWGSNWEDTAGNWEHWASPLPPAQGRTLLTSLQPRPRGSNQSPLPSHPHHVPPNQLSPFIRAAQSERAFFIGQSRFRVSAAPRPISARRGSSQPIRRQGAGLPREGPVPPLPQFGGPGAPPGTKRPQKGPKKVQNDPEPPNRLTPAPAIY